MNLKINLNWLISFLAVSILHSTCYAGTRAGLELTSGSCNYHGSDFNLRFDLSKKVGLGLDFSSYSSNRTPAGSSNFSSNLSIDLGKNFLLDIVLGIAPEKDGYKNNFLGMNLSGGFSLNEQETPDSSDYWIDMGIGFNNTSHYQYVFEIIRQPYHYVWWGLGENSLDMNVGITFFKSTAVSFNSVKYSYNRDVMKIYEVAQSTGVLGKLLAGSPIFSLVQGVPKDTFTFSFSQKIGKYLDIAFSKTIMRYLINTGSENSLDSYELNLSCLYFYPFEFGISFDISSPRTSDENKTSSINLAYTF